MKIQHLMALAVLSLATVPGAQAAVQAGPLTNAANGHLYYLLSRNTWTASEAEARGLGGHLVTINDAAENQWVLDTFLPLMTGVPDARLWIGLNDAANEGQFVWASGEPVTFTNWYPGEPNNLVGVEHYAAIIHLIFAPPDGRWNDISDLVVNPHILTFGIVEVSLSPVATTQPADQFMPGSARLNGQADPRGSPTLAWFEWGTSLAYGNATPPQSVGSGSNVVGFSNVLVGLVNGTDYHFRARASNAFGFAAGPDQTLNLNSQRPVVTTLAAEQLANTNALLRGQVNPRGWPTAAWFEWGTSTNYGNLIGMQDVGQGASVSNLDVVLDGLMIGSNYHYRVVATNAFGGVYGADQTFKMRQRATVLAGPLGNVANGHAYYLLSDDTWTASEAEARRLGGHLVTINDAAENQWVLNTFFPLTGVPYASLWIGLNDAVNEGQFVWASGEPVTFTYWYPGEPNNLGGEDYATIRHPSEVPPTGSWNDLSDTSGLQNPTAPTFGVVEVPTLLPVAVTQPADQFMPDGARLNGQANANGSPTLAWFEWGTSLAYGNVTPPQSVGSGGNVVGFSNVLVGLVNGTEYHFRARASNAFGSFAGLDQTFNLNSQRPVVTTLAADQLSSTSARLRGQVNPRGWPTAAWFEWGTDTNYGNLIGIQDIGQGSSVSNLNVVLDGLMVGSNYHYRVVATNAFGAVSGANQTFKPAQRPPTTITWTGTDPSRYWSAPVNWSPAGVPVDGDELVFPGGLPPADMVSTNDLTDSIFRSIRFVQGGGHTIRGNPITLTNTSVIMNSGTNVIACDLTFSGTPSPSLRAFFIGGSGSFNSGELTVIGNVGGGSLWVGVGAGRVVIRGQFTGGSLFVDWYSTLALYGDNPHPISADVVASTLLVQGSQPNLNIRLGFSIKTLTAGSLSGDGVVGDVTGGSGSITLDSTLSVKNVSVGSLFINLNGTNVGEYGRLIASGDVTLYGGSLLASAGFNPQAGQVFTIVEKTSPGPIANAFLGPEGRITTLNGMPFRISYVGGDGNDVTLTVETNTRPTVTITNPPNAAVFTAPASFSLAASASDPDGSVTNVQFFRDATSLGNDSSSPYSASVSGLAAGNYTLSAVASDNHGLRATNSIVVTVAGQPPTTNTWTGADPSGYWSAPANWSPAGVPVNGNDLVFPGGLPPGDMVSTNDLTASFFHSIRFVQAGGHTIRGNPITLTNRSDCIIHNGTNVIACDVIFSGTPSPPALAGPTIRGSSYPGGELTVIGNVGGGTLYVGGMRLVIRGQFTGASLRLFGADLALYGDNPNPVSLDTQVSTIFVQGSQPNLNIRMLFEFETAGTSYLSGDGVIGDVTGGYGHITLNSTLSVKNVSLNNWLNIHLNGTNVGEYGRLVASGDVILYSGRLLPSAGFNPQAGQVFTILEKTSPDPITTNAFVRTSEFLGPEGTITTLNGMPFRISYVGGDGNDVTLTAITPVPIVLGAVQHFGTQFVFSYSADVGLRYAVERSATLSNWTTIRSDTANVNPMTVTDTAATNRMNFYRVRLLPNP